MRLSLYTCSSFLSQFFCAYITVLDMPQTSISPYSTEPAAIATLCSMATRHVLSALAQQFAQIQSPRGLRVDLTAIGGVDAAARVRAGQAWDVVILAERAIAQLAAEGWLQPHSIVPWVLSTVAAVAAQNSPDFKQGLAWHNAQDVQNVVLQAQKIGYSTGPSGVALCQLFHTWGIWNAVQQRMVQAPAGVPVQQLLATKQVSLGFQQSSEMHSASGVTLLGPLPRDCALRSMFSAALSARAAPAAASWLQFLQTDAAQQCIVQFGFDSAAHT